MKAAFMHLLGIAVFAVLLSAIGFLVLKSQEYQRPNPVVTSVPVQVTSTLLETQNTELRNQFYALLSDRHELLSKTKFQEDAVLSYIAQEQADLMAIQDTDSLPLGSSYHLMHLMNVRYTEINNFFFRSAQPGMMSVNDAFRRCNSLPACQLSLQSTRMHYIGVGLATDPLGERKYFVIIVSPTSGLMA